MLAVPDSAEDVLSIHNTFIQLRQEPGSDFDAELRPRRRCNSLPDLRTELCKESPGHPSEASTVASAADSDEAKLDDVKTPAMGQQADQPQFMVALAPCGPCGYNPQQPVPPFPAPPTAWFGVADEQAWGNRPWASCTPVAAVQQGWVQPATIRLSQQCAKIANQVRTRLVAKGHALKAEVACGADGNWYVTADVEEVNSDVAQRVLASARNVITALAASDPSLRLLGQSSECFAETPDGLGIVAMLADAPDGDEFCWDFYELGHCPRKPNACRWAHPSACASLTVAVNDPTSTLKWPW